MSGMFLSDEQFARLLDALARVEPLPAAEAYVLHAGYEMTTLDVEVMVKVWEILMPGTRIIPISGTGARLEPLPEADAYVMHTPYLMTDAAAATMGAAWRERMPDTRLIVVDGGGRLTGVDIDAAAARARAQHVRTIYGVEPEPWSDEMEDVRQRWRGVMRAAFDV